MQLPVEVLEAIVDQASDHTSTLRLLSLTCATLLPRSRHHLFSSIAIRTVEQLESSREFVDLRPWIVSLVRKVALFVNVPRDNTKPNVRLLDVAPIHLLARLPNLRSWSMGAEGIELAAFDPSLSLHRAALQCYRKYGVRIQSLELCSIVFDRVSDFKGLVSVFTDIDTLICYDLRIKSRIHELSRAGGFSASPNTNIQPLVRISTLQTCTSVDNRALEYLLIRSGPKLKHLTIQLRATDYRTDGCFDQLEASMVWLTGLSSLTLALLPGSVRIPSHAEGFSRILISASRILQQVHRSNLKDVRVEFKPNPIASLAVRLSGPSAPLEACQQLEKAILTFPNSTVLVRGPVHYRRAGRAEFWHWIIRRAFPKLRDQGILTLKFTPPKADAPDPVGHEAAMTSMVISHDSTRLATSSSDGTIIIWDMESRTVLQEWLAHEGRPVTALDFSPDSRRLVSAGGHTLTVWDIDSSSDGAAHCTKAAELDGHADTVVVACAWSPDGALVASTSLDNSVRIWDARTYRQRELLPATRHSKELQCLQFSPDARYLAWISGGKDCCVWTQRPLAGTRTRPDPPIVLPSHPDSDHRRDVDTVSFSFDHESRRIATAHGSHNRDPDACVVRIWDAATGAALAVLKGHSETVWHISFKFSTPEGGRSLLSVSGQSMAMWLQWDCGTWSRERTGVFQFSESESESARAESPSSLPCPRNFRHDGKYMAAGLEGGQVQLWRTGDGSCVATFEEHNSDVRCIAFSPDGRFLVSGDGEGIVHIRRISEIIGE